MKRDEQAPRWLTKIITTFCAPEFAEEIHGDLLERYIIRRRRDRKWIADLKYLLDIISYLRPAGVKRKRNIYKIIYSGMLKNYLVIALRNIIKNKAFSFVNIAGLSIGISACVIIYLIVSYEFSFDTFHADEERIYRVITKSKNADNVSWSGGVTAPLVEAIRIDLSGLETVAAFHYYHAKVFIPNQKHPGKTFESPAYPTAPPIAVTDVEYFKIFQFKWMAGNPKESLTDANKVVLTADRAKLYFGEMEARAYIGKEVIYNDSILVKVSGIINDLKGNTDFKVTDFISFKTILSPGMRESFRLDMWHTTMAASHAFIKLNSGTSPSDIEKGLASLLNKNIENPGMGSYRELKLQKLTDIHFAEYINADYVRTAHLPTLYSLIGIAVFLLIMGCINFVNLSTAISSTRAREIGVRKVIGQSRKSLIIQFYVETTVLTVLAVLTSLVLMHPLIYLFNDFIPQQVYQQIVTPHILVFLFLVAFITSLLAGFYPAIIMSSFSSIVAVKSKVITRSWAGVYVRKGLIAFQFCISLVFVIGAIFVNNQIQYLLNRDLGFTKEAIINFRVDRQNDNNRRFALVQKLNSLSDVEQVSLSESTPAGRETFTNVINYTGGKELVSTEVNNKFGDSNYLSLYNIKLIAGKNLLSSDTLKEFVINDTYRKVLGFDTPHEAIGHELEMWGKKVPIVGVVSDFHVHSLHEPLSPTAIASANGFCYNINIKMNRSIKTTSSVKNTLTAIEKVWKEVYPDQGSDYQFFDESIAHL